jgi:hypothetical protein
MRDEERKWNLESKGAGGRNVICQLQLAYHVSLFPAQTAIAIIFLV